VKKLRNPLPGWIPLVLLLTVGLNLFWFHFVARERALYAWDHVAHWSMSLSLARDLREDPGGAVSGIAASVWRDELNLLPAVLPALVLLQAGNSRGAFILSILDLYSIPALILGLLLLFRWTGKDSGAGMSWLISILLLPAFWQPLSLGYPGSGGLPLAFLVLGLGLRDLSGDTEASSGWPRLPALAFLLALLTLFRRWWAFWSLSFCLVWAGAMLFRAWREREERRLLLQQLMLTGSATLLFLLIIGGPRILKIVQTDYAGRFIHYKGHEGLAGAFVLLKTEFGVLGLSVFLLSWLILLRDRKWRPRALFLGVHSFLTAALFFRVQDPSPQHWYLLMPALLLIPAAALESLRSRPVFFRAMAAIYCVIGLLLGSIVFTGRPAAARGLGPELRISPARRGDLQEIRRLMAFLDEREALQPGWIYVLSGTGILPDSGLAYINLSLGSHYRSPPRILTTQQVDLRDGFPRGLFQARYILVPEPPQYRGTTQRIIEFPAEDFRRGQGIAKAFSAVGSDFILDGGVHVRVFERIRPNTREEMEKLAERLRSCYPEHPEVWAVAD